MGVMQKVGDLLRLDGFRNFITKAGDKARDKRTGGYFLAQVLTRQDLEHMYAASALAGRIVDLPADEMVRAWIHFKGPSTEEQTAIAQACETLKVQAELADGLRWARLYGTGLVFIGAVDGARNLAEPLDLKNISSIKYLKAFDREDFTVSKRDQYGEPLTYTKVINEGAPVLVPDGTPIISGREIHRSRFLRFEGTKTPPRRRREFNEGFSDSVFVRLFETLRGYHGSWSSAEALLEDFSQAVIKIKGLADAMAAHGEDKVLARMEMIDTARSVLRALILDAEDEDFERKPTPMSGLPELLDRFLSRVAGDAGMPITMLFGTSPAGLNATGDSDIRFFYDSIARRQETELRPQLEYLLRIMFAAKDGPTKGVEPKVWSFVFNKLWQRTEKEQAELEKVVAEKDQIYFNAGILTAAEIADSRFGTGVYSTETILDFETRNYLKKAAEAELKGGDDIQSQAFNGAQGATLLSTIEKVAAGTIPRNAGIRSIALLFQITDEEADKLLAEAGTPQFTPTVPEPPQPPSIASGGEKGGRPEGAASE